VLMTTRCNGTTLTFSNTWKGKRLCKVGRFYSGKLKEKVKELHEMAGLGDVLCNSKSSPLKKRHKRKEDNT